MDAVARKMPVIVRKIEIEEGPYTGWWAEMRINPPMRVIDELTREMDAAQFGTLVQSWNFVDEDGAPVAVGDLFAVPPHLFAALWRLYLREVWHPFWLTG